MPTPHHIFTPLELPNGTRLKNRIVKAAMSDSLGDGRGNPTGAQLRLYERWARGGVAVSIIGEVQGDPNFAERPGNLVLDAGSDAKAFRELARAGSVNGARLWLQLGHAGALAPPSIGTPKGPSALDLPGLRAQELSLPEIRALPDHFARTARLAASLGFGGVEIHAAHGFLLSQFLSPLFNRRGDAYGGTLRNRMRLLLEVVEAVRAAVAPGLAVAVKINATDQLEGGLVPEEALDVVCEIGRTGVDLIDISGGTYFPGARSSSDRAATGPYFLDFASAARRLTPAPLMATGGFKHGHEAEAAIASGCVDAVGLARAMVLDPDLPSTWRNGGPDPRFPRFRSAPPGGVTAWFTMQLARIAEAGGPDPDLDVTAALEAYEKRDATRTAAWNARFRHNGQES